MKKVENSTSSKKKHAAPTVDATSSASDPLPLVGGADALP